MPKNFFRKDIVDRNAVANAIDSEKRLGQMVITDTVLDAAASVLGALIDPRTEALAKQ